MQGPTSGVLIKYITGDENNARSIGAVSYCSKTIVSNCHFSRIRTSAMLPCRLSVTTQDPVLPTLHPTTMMFFVCLRPSNRGLLPNFLIIFPPKRISPFPKDGPSVTSYSQCTNREGREGSVGPSFVTFLSLCLKPTGTPSS